MQPMRNLLLIIVLIFVCAVDARATVVMDWAQIGYAGNAGDPADPLPPFSIPPNTITYGAVNYNYQISKYDVTNNQYVEFLNDKDPTGANSLHLYTSPAQGFGGIAFNPAAASGSKYSSIDGRGTMPVNYVSQYSAMRFANWLNNGQGNADTESGSYTLLGGGASPTNQVTRNADAHIVLPTENEWYKAAYYNPATTTYFPYPGSNSLPNGSLPTLAANSANWNSAVGDLTPVGAYSNTMSSFGTFDQFGDVVQWLDPTGAGLLRGIPFFTSSLDAAGFDVADAPQSVYFQSAIGDTPAISSVGIGFRVAMVPEPSSVALAAFGMIGFAAWGWRRRKRSRT